jgi:hypothetical protein
VAQWSDLWTDEADKTSGTKIRLWAMFFICSTILICDFFVKALSANVALLTIVLGTFVVDRGVSKVSNMKYNKDSGVNVDYGGGGSD